jgi:UDP-glucose 4-epimerase
MRHLIIGNSGFVGKHLEKYLAEKYKKKNVFGFASKFLNLTKKENYKKIDKFIKKNTTIYFLAFNKNQKNASLKDYEINHKIITNFLNYIETKKIKKFLFFSTQSIYGEDTDNKNITEKTLPDPTSYYGIAKYNCERLIEKVFTEIKIPFLIIRTPRIYGLGDNPQNYGPSMFTDKFKKKEIISLWGDGSEKRNYLYIDDVTNIINILILKNYIGAINICSNSNNSFKYLIQRLNFITKNKIKIVYKKRSRKKADQIMNNNFLKKIIGNYKFTSIDDGLKKLLK